VCAAAVSLALIAPSATSAATDKILQSRLGTVSSQANATADKVPLALKASQVLPDDAFALTEAKSSADVILPDSSDVQLGELTKVQVGAFNDPVSATPTRITIANGRVAFNVKRPPGGKSNYRFVTPTSSISVRGTVGLLDSDLAQGDTIACLECAAGDVTVTVKGTDYPLTSGQVLRVSLAGVVTIVALTAAIVTIFSSAGISTAFTGAGAGAAAGGAAGGAASGAGAGAGGAASGSAAAAAGVSSTAVVAGAAVAAAAAVAVASSNKSAASPAPTSTAAPISIQSIGRATPPSPAVSPSPSPAAQPRVRR
jgi:hypothetical protein